MAHNGWVYETFGISKRFPIKPLQCLLNVPTLISALSAKCFIYRVTNWPLFIFNQLAINFAVPCVFGQTHSLTSFGRAFGILSDLAMCVAVKRWHYIIHSISLYFSFILSQNPLLQSITTDGFQSLGKSLKIASTILLPLPLIGELIS